MFDTANPGGVAYPPCPLSGGDVSINENWTTPGRFTLSGLGAITGNGNLSYFESPLVIAISGGTSITCTTSV